MAVIEIWWGDSNWQVSAGTTVEHGPAGYSLQGNLVGERPLTITGRFFLGASRINFAPTRCISPPVAHFSGELSAETGQSLMMDGDPRIQVRQVLQQRVHLNERLIAEGRAEQVLLDIKGDRKSKTVPLGLHNFPPLAFGVTPGAELRIDLIVSFIPWYHKNRPGVRLQGLLQLLQWGIIYGVGG